MAFAPMLMVALSAGATAMSAIGQIRQGQAAQAAAQYNAQVGENNAKMVEQQTQAQAMMQARRASMQQGDMLANFGASGVDATEGSPLEILSQSAANAEMDRQNIVYGGRVKAQALRNQASLDVMQGDTALENGYMSAAGTLLSGGAKAYGMYKGAGSTISTNG